MRRDFGFVVGPQVLLSAEGSYRGLCAAPGSPLSPGLTHSSMFLVAAMTDFAVPYSLKCAAAVTVLTVDDDGVV